MLYFKLVILYIEYIENERLIFLFVLLKLLFSSKWVVPIGIISAN